ncbi:hypothetical protein EQG49_04195 [Periweissella cryptocerci]|uniref:Uncharacterized protein n=1 Tax=Periweissella cryptocerci TaxID=2506420 RepID=A0A4P6YSM8_9LACO|nr:hypothetical protein [Periweissella cryptocerci]QBO35718.1 hypothetical protein EQG49_04195 [Periweissella cryptocerci]
MVRIEKIDWLDEERCEGFLLLTDDTFKLTVFSDGTFWKENQAFQDDIFIFDETLLTLVNTRTASVKLITENEQELVGELSYSPNAKLIIGDFNIDLEGLVLPNDVNEGDYLRIIVTRLDTY